MKRKTKNMLILSAILITVTLIGAFYSFSIQKKEIVKKNQKVNELRITYANTEALKSQLTEIERSGQEIDQLIALYPVNIPNSVPEEKFFDFVNKYSKEYFIYTGASVEYKEKKKDKDLTYYVYRVYGTGRFIDVYNLIYSIEHSRELKKIESAEIKANTIVNSEGIPKYLVSFDFLVDVYFSNNDLFSSSKYVENILEPHIVYNAYFPLIRNEIPPNLQDLPDVQNATLISLVPQGAFIKVSGENTFLMKKGDQVYLGYLTDIDYSSGTVTFTLNKGGLVEDLTLELGNKKNKGK